MKNILIISQVITQLYVDTLTAALGNDVHIDIITGSRVRGNVISTAKHEPESFRSRFCCWMKHYRFVKTWMRENKERKYDFIFMTSNPPINSYIGMKLKRQFHAPLLYMNWDLYPQCIEYIIKSPIVKPVCKLWHWWNNRNYCKIDQILTIGKVISESINKELKQKLDIKVIPIMVDTEQLKPVSKEENPFCIEHGLINKFVVLYSGKMGYGHNIEMILKAAEMLKDYENIAFVFIGEGPKYMETERFIKEHELRNAMLLPFQPDEIFPYSMACGDVGVVSQEMSMAHLFMPSKTYSMMASGMAIIGICSEHDDLQSLICESQCGKSITSLDEKELVHAILEMYQEKEQLEVYKRNSLREVRDKYSKEAIVKRYEKLFYNYLR